MLNGGKTALFAVLYFIARPSIFEREYGSFVMIVLIPAEESRKDSKQECCGSSSEIVTP